MTVRGCIAAFRRREEGASLIEYTVVVSLFLLVFFSILDFGRLGFNWVMTEKAMQRAARIAVVRPPVCADVPETHALSTSTTGASFGMLCRAGGCEEPTPRAPTCILGNIARTPADSRANCNTMDLTGMNATAVEIWRTLCPILPLNAGPENIYLRYEYDDNLGFAGGPYVPMVEVGVVTTGPDRLCFDFITPIPGIAALVGGVANVDRECSGAAASIPFPDMSVSLPGEDLNQGNNG